MLLNRGGARVVHLLALTGLLVGCGGGGEHSTHPVTGTVKRPDGTPVTSGNILFESQEMQLSTIGEIQPDGTYTLTTYSSGDGAPAGKYVVTITGAMEADTRSYEEASAGKGTPPKPLIDQKYSNRDTSGLTAEVTSGKNNIDFVVDPPQ